MQIGILVFHHELNGIVIQIFTRNTSAQSCNETEISNTHTCDFHLKFSTWLVRAIICNVSCNSKIFTIQNMCALVLSSKYYQMLYLYRLFDIHERFRERFINKIGNVFRYKPSTNFSTNFHKVQTKYKVRTKYKLPLQNVTREDIAIHHYFIACIPY